MKKYSSFSLIFIISLLVSCIKSKNMIVEDNSFESVWVRSDATAQPCSGGYIFRDSISLKYQSYDPLPGNPVIGLDWISAKIKFHKIDSFHCPWVMSRIVVDEIKF